MTFGKNPKPQNLAQINEDDEKEKAIEQKKLIIFLLWELENTPAVLTKWDSWDLYRRFIFDIKDEFLRLVFRQWKSIETRNEFTKSIWELEFMKELKAQDKRETISNVFGEVTNLIYMELFGVKAIEYKASNNIPESYFAKDFFTKDGLFDLEKLENKLAVIIEYLSPKTRDDLKSLIVDFLNKEVKLGGKILER